MVFLSLSSQSCLLFATNVQIMFIDICDIRHNHVPVPEVEHLRNLIRIFRFSVVNHQLNQTMKLPMSDMINNPISSNLLQRRFHGQWFLCFLLHCGQSVDRSPDYKSKISNKIQNRIVLHIKMVQVFRIAYHIGEHQFQQIFSFKLGTQI